VDWLIETYLTQLRSPYELIQRTLERSRDRFQREYSKLEALMEQAKFFTDEGVKERKEKLKLKMFMN
jgi:uncharacterized protein YigA (DUF484 family)